MTFLNISSILHKKSMQHKRKVTTQVLLHVSIGSKKLPFPFFISIKGEVNYQKGDEIIPCDPNSFKGRGIFIKQAKWYLDERNDQTKVYEAKIRFTTDTPVEELKKDLKRAGWTIEKQ